MLWLILLCVALCMWSLFLLKELDHARRGNSKLYRTIDKLHLTIHDQQVELDGWQENYSPAKPEDMSYLL